MAGVGVASAGGHGRVAQGGLPYVNVLANDRHGMRLFANVPAVPHITDEHARRCNTVKGRELFSRFGLPVLDGSRTDCAPLTDPDSLVPGTFGAHRMPTLISRDQLSNSNDSHWLTSAKQPLTGFPRVFGTTRTPRTRFGLQERVTSLASAQEMVLSRRSFMGELGHVPPAEYEALHAMTQPVTATLETN